MTSNHRSQRIDRHKSINPPIPWECRRARNHQPRTRKTENKCKLKTFEEAWDFFKERYVFDLLCGGTPCHVDLEKVTEEGLGYVEGDATEEDGEEEEPFEILED